MLFWTAGSANRAATPVWLALSAIFCPISGRLYWLFGGWTGVNRSARVRALGYSEGQNITGAAQALGLHLHILEVRSADVLDTAVTAILQERADVLIVLSDPALMSPLRGRVVDLAAESRLPAMYDWKFYVESGGLMSYGPSLQDTYRRVAIYVDKILKGATPADLPVEQAIKFELVLNFKTTKALGITFPPALLIQADEVLQ